METKRPVVDEPARPKAAPQPVVLPPRDQFVWIEEVNGSLVDVYFAYDRSELTEEALEALRKNAALLAPLLRSFPELEDQLCALTWAGFMGAGSPDRADAMVWAMTELFEKEPALPRVRGL